MYCRHCGHELPDAAVFCAYCGKPTIKPEQGTSQSASRNADQGSILERANCIAGHFVPAQLARRFPAVMPVAFIGMYAVTLLIATMVISGIAGAVSHDLSGTYWASDFFPVDVITFRTDGSFTAVSNVGYTETYQGKYSKSLNGEYTLRFTEGSVDGGSPVTRYEVSTIGQQYELSVEKVDERTLKVRVLPKTDYFAWGGTAVYFYGN